MENQKVTSKSIILNNGLKLGLVSILISVANYSFGNAFDPHWSVNVIGLIVMIAFIVLGNKQLKESNGGYLKLGEAIKIGIGISLISVLISIVYFLIFVNFVEPDFFNIIIDIQEQKWMDAEMSDEQIDASKAIMEKMSGPGMTSAFMIAGGMFFGFIISLISGLVMKKSNEEISSI